MNGLGSPDRPHFLILDDNPADAALLRQMLLSTFPGTEVRSHQSGQGLLPTDMSSFQICLLADGYAQSPFLPLVQLLSLNHAKLRIILTGDANAQAKSLVEAAAQGISEFIDKSTVSQQQLRELLRKDHAGSLRSTETAGISGAAITAQAQPEEPSTLATQTTSTSPADAGAASIDDDLLLTLRTGIIVLQKHGDQFTYKLINPAAAAIEQLQIDALLGRSLEAADFNFQNFDLNAALMTLGSSGLKTEPVLSLDDKGQPHWRELSLSPQGDRIVIEIHDVTEAMIASAENAEYDTLWEDLGRSLPAFCLTLGEELSVDQYLAGDWSQITSKPETLPGTALGDLFGEELQQQAQRVLNTGKASSTTLTLERPQGQLCLQLTIAPMRSAVGLPRRLVLLAHDISEQRVMLESLSADYQAVSEVLQNAPFGVAIKDLDGRYERVNSYFEALCAERTDTIIGQTDADIFDSEVHGKLQALEQSLQEIGEIQQKTLPLPDAHSEQRYRIIKIPLHQNQDQLRAIATIVLPVQIVTGKKNKKAKKAAATES